VVLVIPAYRESARLPEFGAALLKRLDEFEGAVTLQVVDDGSGAEEAGNLERLIDGWRARRDWVSRLVTLRENCGKGGAVYAGWDGALAEMGDAEWLGFCDADGSVDAGETARLIRMLGALPAGVCALIASRRAIDSRCQGRTAGRSRAALLFSIWVRCWTKLNLRDTQCGCKFVRVEDYRRERPHLMLRRFAFDVELLSAVSGRGGRILEEGVCWRHAPGGSLRVWRDGLAMLAGVVSLAFKRRRRE
jgi:glycosyltransferase involved in cell wall biosynthesis